MKNDNNLDEVSNKLEKLYGRILFFIMIQCTTLIFLFALIIFQFKKIIL